MLEKFIKFRSKLSNCITQVFGFEGDFNVYDEDDLKLLAEIPEKTIRELFILKTQAPIRVSEIKTTDSIHIVIDTTTVDGYFELMKDFISKYKYDLPEGDFYIHEINYLNSLNTSNKIIDSYKRIISLIQFLEKVSSYSQINRGSKYLFFQKTDKLFKLELDYNIEMLESIKFDEDICDIAEHVLNNSDKETRIKLFNEELINILYQKTGDFMSVVQNWNKISSSYQSSFSLYLSEFSFQKIKATSQEYFHELTDRIYSTIHKFSTYILAIPIAYLLILRFFDFSGESLAKDSFLMVAGILYFVVIWCVLLNNLTKAFQTIENDITRFLDRIKNEEGLSEIIYTLNNQKNSLIPNQKRRIFIVRIITIMILALTISAFIYIHFNNLKSC